MSEDEEKSALSNSKHRLYSHVLQKGFQTGALVGLGVGVPLLTYFRRGRLEIQKQPFLPAALQRVGASAVFVTLATGVATAALIALKPIDEEGIQDRAYRLYWNEAQNDMDKLARIGALGGAVASAVAIGRSPSIILGGAAVGAALGVLTHNATWQPEILTRNNVPSELLRNTEKGSKA